MNQKWIYALVIGTFLSGCVSIGGSGDGGSVLKKGNTDGMVVFSGTQDRVGALSNQAVDTENLNKDIAAVVSYKVFFDTDMSSLDKKDKETLASLAKSLKAVSKKGNLGRIMIAGHTDERGSRMYNLALGLRRAQSVKSYLISQGVREDIEVISYGKDRPEFTASTAYDWSMNRRAVIIALDHDGIKIDM